MSSRRERVSDTLESVYQLGIYWTLRILEVDRDDRNRLEAGSSLTLIGA